MADVRPAISVYSSDVAQKSLATRIRGDVSPGLAFMSFVTSLRCHQRNSIFNTYGDTYPRLQSSIGEHGHDLENRTKIDTRRPSSLEKRSTQHGSLHGAQ